MKKWLERLDLARTFHEIWQEAFPDEVPPPVFGT
jgi:hypothetical protein